MAPKDMKAYMEAQRDMILEAYEHANPMMSLDDFTILWVDVNARMFRETYRVDRDQ